jgi:hypothetical protein
MRLIVISAIVLFTVGLGNRAARGDKQGGDSVLRDDLYHVELSDGSWLRIQTALRTWKEQQTSGVGVALYPKGKGGNQPVIWTAHLTSVDYVPGNKCYYALVKVMDDRIFIFSMWNGQHCMIDKQTGRILKKGKGDDALKEYRDLVPLKLTIATGFPSTGHTMTKKEAEEMEKEELEGERQASAISRIQSIPGSKLQKFYVIQFDKAESKRRPLAVIVWKAHRAGRISLDHLDKAVPAISINGHSVTPSPTKKAIYALQPDYSLQQLPLTDEEITHLFSHITRSEERVVSSYERELFPSDPYWEQKVDPHLNAVEPPQKDTR